MNGLSMQMLLLDAATALVGFATNWLLQSTLLIAAGLAIVAEGIADEDGHYQLNVASVSSKTHQYPGLVARMEGTAIAWRMLNLDAPTTEVALELPPEEPIRGKLMDIQGQPAPGVLLTIWAVAARGASGRLGEQWMSYPGGLDVRRQLGATATLKTGGLEQVDVVLQPCGKARLQAVDSQGEPVAGYEVSVEMVVTPGAHQFDRAAMRRGELAADADFVDNIDEINHSWPPTKSDEQGFVTVPALIPGANYRIVFRPDGQFQVAKDFQAKGSQTLDLGDLVVERPQ